MALPREYKLLLLRPQSLKSKCWFSPMGESLEAGSIPYLCSLSSEWARLRLSPATLQTLPPTPIPTHTACLVPKTGFQETCLALWWRERSVICSLISPTPFRVQPFSHLPLEEQEPHSPACVKGQLQTRWTREMQAWKEIRRGQGSAAVGEPSNRGWGSEKPQGTWSSGPAPHLTDRVWPAKESRSESKPKPQGTSQRPGHQASQSQVH